MKKALFIIDYQYDFVADDGKLTVGKPAQLIEAKISEIAESFDDEDIYFTFDNHSESDWETDIYPEPRVFPKHCISGTKGAELYGNLKGRHNEKNFVFKHAYCPDFDFLAKIIEKYDHVTVTGLVTDICVFQTVIGLFTAFVNRGKKFEITVVSSACASFNPEREKWALDYLREVLSVNVE